MALQQPQLPQQGIGQLLRVIGQIKGALLEHGGQERRQLLAAAVEPGHRQGGGGALRRPAQPQALAAPQWGQRLGQPMGRLNGHIAITWGDDWQAFTAQTGGHRSIAGHQRQPHPLTARTTRQTPAAGIQVLGRNPAG